MEISSNCKIGIAFAAGIATAVVGTMFIGKAKAAGGSGPAEIWVDAPVARPKSGFAVYIGAHGGMTLVNTEVSAEAGPFSAAFDGVGGRGMIGGVHIGADYVFESNSKARPFVGVFGSYSWQDTESTLDLAWPINHTLNASAGLSDSYAVGGRAGVDWGKFKIYALAAYRHTELEGSVVKDGNAADLSKAGLPGSLTGVDLGVGTGLMINKHIELGVEAIWTNYKEETIGKDGPKLNADQLQ